MWMFFCFGCFVFIFLVLTALFFLCFDLGCPSVNWRMVGQFFGCPSDYWLWLSRLLLVAWEFVGLVLLLSVLIFCFILPCCFGCGVCYLPGFCSLLLFAFFLSWWIILAANQSFNAWRYVSKVLFVVGSNRWDITKMLYLNGFDQIVVYIRWDNTSFVDVTDYWD